MKTFERHYRRFSEKTGCLHFFSNVFLKILLQTGKRGNTRNLAESLTFRVKESPK